MLTTEAEAGDKRKRSRSRERTSSHSHHHSSRGDSPSRKRDRRDDPPTMESLDWVASTNVQLDRYNCDLNCEVRNLCAVTKSNFLSKVLHYHD